MDPNNTSDSISPGIFTAEEDTIRQNFLITHDSDVVLFNKLLHVYEAFLSSTSDKVRNDDFPNWTILILLSQTLPLMNNAMSLLACGYLRSSEIMIRVTSESVILSNCFKFPEIEKDYRAKNYREFFHDYPIESMLKKVQEEGTIFIADKALANSMRWHKMVFKNTFEEASRFLHSNPNLLYDLTVDNQSLNSDKVNLIMGPQQYRDESVSMGIKRIFNITLYSLLVLGVSLGITPDDEQIEIINQSNELVKNISIK